MQCAHALHDDAIKWKGIPRCWPFVRGINRSLVNSPHRGRWRAALMFSLMVIVILCTRVKRVDAVRLRVHDDVIKWKYFPRCWLLVWESTGHR